jgi:hypothetical protein
MQSQSRTHRARTGLRRKTYLRSTKTKSRTFWRLSGEGGPRGSGVASLTMPCSPVPLTAVASASTPSPSSRFRLAGRLMLDARDSECDRDGDSGKPLASTTSGVAMTLARVFLLPVFVAKAYLSLQPDQNFVGVQVGGSNCSRPRALRFSTGATVGRRSGI